MFSSNPKTISILGCGWLGLPLAKIFLKSGFIVKGSTTHSEKFPTLKEAGITSYLIQCEPDIETNQVKDFFLADTLVITIPFKRNLEDPGIYKKQIDSIVAVAVSLQKINFIVFTSSTSVYPQTMSLAEEDVAFVPDNPRSQILWEIEQGLLTQERLDATVIRCGGLYGETRPIGRFLAGQKDLRDGDQAVNLIHQEDAVRIIFEVIRQNMRGQIFNACSDDHPTRRKLYTQAALKQGLAPPTFSSALSPSPQKIVSNRKLKEKLQYRFIHPTLLEE